MREGAWLVDESMDSPFLTLGSERASARLGSPEPSKFFTVHRDRQTLESSTSFTSCSASLFAPPRITCEGNSFSLIVWPEIFEGHHTLPAWVEMSSWHDCSPGRNPISGCTH